MWSVDLKFWTEAVLLVVVRVFNLQFATLSAIYCVPLSEATRDISKLILSTIFVKFIVSWTLDIVHFNYTSQSWMPVHSLSEQFTAVILHRQIVCKGKAIPVRSRGGPYGCETSRLPHFLDNRFTRGGVRHYLLFTQSTQFWYEHAMRLQVLHQPLWLKRRYKLLIIQQMWSEKWNYFKYNHYN
jgi:hypothetical protein